MSGGAAEAAWRTAVDRVLKGADFAQTLVARSDDGFPIHPLYQRAAGSSLARDAARPFGILQRIDHPDPEAANRIVLDDLGNGATGLTLSFAGAAAARSFGLRAHGDDLERVLAGVDLEALAIRCETGGEAGAVVEAVLDLVRRRNLAPATLDIDLGLDPIGDMARRGVMPSPWPDLARQTAATIVTLRDQGFGAPLLGVDGRSHHEAGASEGQELAAMMATGVAYLRALEAGGLPLDDARTVLSFTIVADADQFLTMAKLRAFRKLWAQVERACGLAARPARLHAETAWRMLTRRDPWTNLLRNTIAAAAAILGGADSLGVLPFTSALGLPEVFARRLARTTPLVLLEEAHLGRIADPAAGSGAIEGLTDELCSTAWGLFQGIEHDGGLPASLAAGTWQATLAATRAVRRGAFAAGTRVLIGSTLFPDPGQPPPAVERPAPAPAAPRDTPFPGLPSLRDEDLAGDPASPAAASHRDGRT